VTAALRTTMTRYGSAVWVLVCAIAVAVFLLYARIPTTPTDHSAPDAAQLQNGPVVVPRSHPLLVPGVRAITSTKRGTFALTGVAASATTGKSLAGARVTLTSGSTVRRARTNALGAWSFADVPPGDGSWTIRVAAPGYGVFVETNTTFLANTAYEMTSALSPKP
jgi:Carboxypeptidase regulatory-like domain